jgi:hypothetical protein
MKKIIPVAVLFLSIIIYAGIKYSTGITGTTLKNSGAGCNCHSAAPATSVKVWIEGMDSVFVGDTVHYKIFMSGGPAVDGGFNVASYFGKLNSVNSLAQVLNGELTHTSPNPFVNDTVHWNFSYIAPDSAVTDTLYSVANSVNGNGNPSGDEWNYGENFPIHILATPTYARNNYRTQVKFVLEQNYPNPFNPTTKISWQTPVSGQQVLKVYDISGREVATLVNEYRPAGNYEISFDGSKLSSGIYIYSLQSGKYISVKKMILLK